MNTTTLLTEQQTTNRVVKAQDIYNNGLISKLNQREYLVKATYIVEDLTTKDDIEPFFKCSCPDHTYRNVECSHILSVQYYLLNEVGV